MAGKVDLLFEQSRRALDNESQRSERLTAKSEVYLLATTVFVGFGLIELPKPLEFNDASGWLSICAFALLFVAFVMCLAALRTRPYCSYPKLEDASAAISDEAIDVTGAKAILTKTYSKALLKNQTINSGRAHTLAWVGLLIVTGFLLAVASRAAAG